MAFRLVLACLALAGAGDMPSGLGRSTIWHQTIPGELRGRLAGIEVLSYSVGPTWARSARGPPPAGRGRGLPSGRAVSPAWRRWGR